MRRDRDWSQTQAFEALREGLRLGPKSRASYIKIDMGARVPTLDEGEFLIRFFGRNPDDIPEDDESVDPLVAALQAQTEAILGLAEELRLARTNDPLPTGGNGNPTGAGPGGRAQAGDPRRTS
jgi:hypothetical protein